MTLRLQTHGPQPVARGPKVGLAQDGAPSHFSVWCGGSALSHLNTNGTHSPPPTTTLYAPPTYPMRE